MAKNGATTSVKNKGKKIFYPFVVGMIKFFLFSEVELYFDPCYGIRGYPTEGKIYYNL